MATPSEKYAVDYTDGNGLKWSKVLSQLYPTLGNIDMSAAISSFNDPLVKNVYRKSRIYNPIYDNSITYASVGHDSLVLKYFSRNAYPSESMISGTVIIDHASPDGSSYATGVNEDASVPYNGGMGSSRVLVDTEYNKMLFKVVLREMTLNTSNVPIANINYIDPTYTDVELKDIDDNKWYGLFYHAGAKVWNGSAWVDSSIAPVMICNGSSTQSFQGGGSSFNNLFNNYNGTMGSGQNIEFTNTASNYYWTAHNFVNKMNIENYSLGWSDTYDYKPSYADNFDAMKVFMLNYLIDNNYSPWQTVWFQLCREVHKISDDVSILLTVMCSAQLDNNNALYINWDNIYTFPIIKGSSVSKFLAGYGLYYLTDSSADLTGITPSNLGDCSDIWLGEMSADGTTTGKWIKGSDIDSYTGYNKDGNINNPDFDPSGGGGGGGDDDDIDPNSFGGGSKLGGVDNVWLLTAQQLADLHTAMNNNNDPNFEPLNSIISVLGLAISPLYIFGDDISTVTNITIKKADGTSWSSGVNGHICTSQVSSFGLTGNISIKRKYKNFLDYPPYASHEMFIPLCGWVPLPSCCVGRTLSVYYVPDIQTGGVRGLVICNGSIVAEKYGILGANIPFTSNGHGLMLGGIISGGVQTLADFATAMGGLATGNAMATVFGGASFFSDGFNMALAANQNRTSVIGQNQDRTGFSDGTYIRIKSVYQDVKIDPLFGHTVGYMCHESGTLNNFHGFTVCENPHVHISATSAEREEIKQLLEQGVILPNAK